MSDFPVWALAGLAFGTVLGIVGAFGGAGALLLVLILGVIGFFVGLMMEGGVQMPSDHLRRQ